MKTLIFIIATIISFNTSAQMDDQVFVEKFDFEYKGYKDYKISSMMISQPGLGWGIPNEAHRNYFLYLNQDNIMDTAFVYSRLCLDGPTQEKSINEFTSEVNTFLEEIAPGEKVTPEMILEAKNNRETVVFLTYDNPEYDIIAVIINKEYLLFEAHKQ